VGACSSLSRARAQSRSVHNLHNLPPPLASTSNEPHPASQRPLSDPMSISSPLKIQPPALASLALLESREAAHSSHNLSGNISQRLRLTAPPVRMDSQAKYCGILLRLPIPGKAYREKIWVCLFFGFGFVGSYALMHATASAESTGADGPIPHAVLAHSEGRTEGVVHEGGEVFVEGVCSESARRSAESSSPCGGTINGNGRKGEGVGDEMLTDYWLAWKCVVEDRVDGSLCLVEINIKIATYDRDRLTRYGRFVFFCEGFAADELVEDVRQR